VATAWRRHGRRRERAISRRLAFNSQLGFGLIVHLHSYGKKRVALFGTKWHSGKGLECQIALVDAGIARVQVTDIPGPLSIEFACVRHLAPLNRDGNAQAFVRDVSPNPAWFNLSMFAGNKSWLGGWVAGVELATASEPPARKPRIWGRRPSGVDPSHPLRCNLLLNLAVPSRSLSPELIIKNIFLPQSGPRLASNLRAAKIDKLTKLDFCPFFWTAR
jgi:hypothetical protein